MLDYKLCEIQRIGHHRHNLLEGGKKVCCTDALFIVDFWKRLGAVQIADAETANRWKTNK